MHIYIYSPSGAVRDKAALRRAVKHLTQLGHEVELDPDVLTRSQRFAGDDDIRLMSISRAAASGADVVMPSRGGYGITRLMKKLPYKAIAHSIKQGSRWVGHSDFTALQMGLLAKTGAHSWSGPHACTDFGALSVDEIMQDCFDDMAQSRGEGAGWRIPSSDLIPLPKRNVLAEDAVLWGGNLSVLCSLIGTPYMPAIDKGVLFLEDVAEHPYRIERMLTQLLHAGVLVKQQAIVLGQFTEFKLTAHDKGFKMDSVVSWLRTQVKVPVLTGLPFGHVPTKLCLPLGQKISLLREGREAFLLWVHQGHHSH
ncbi:MAG: LD-carboxypeptidase [Betaproteobacteria bacterium]|jgi:muramoyltetrapeptide carboxypeptidase|nr:LD-carboxypeptidase [Betaproteobacteria bacterium]